MANYTEVVWCGDCGEFDRDLEENRIRSAVSEGGFLISESKLRELAINIGIDFYSPYFVDDLRNLQYIYFLQEDYELVTLTDEEIAHIVDFEPVLAKDIYDFAILHRLDPMQLQVVHDFIAVQSCANAGEGCEVANFPNSFERLFNLYPQLSIDERSWLNEEGQRNLMIGILMENSSTPERTAQLVSLSKSNSLSFSIEATQYLLYNTLTIDEIGNFINTRTDLLLQSRRDAVESYTHLLATDDDFYNYYRGEHAAIPGWMWPLIREVGIEIAKELAIKYGPAGTVGDVIQAVSNLGQGDILGFMGEVIDIVRRKVPALAAISLTLDGIELGGKAAKVWRGIAKMNDFGSEVVTKLLNTIKSQSGGLLDKFKWKNNNIGAELIDVSDPIDFWDEFVGLFPNKNPIDLSNGPANYLEGFEIIPNVEVRIKTGGNTNPGFSMEFKIGTSGYTYKIRFQ